MASASPRGSFEHARDTRLHGARAAARGVDADRAAVTGDRPRVEHFQAVHLQQLLQARHRIVAQVLVIDRVVLQCVESQMR